MNAARKFREQENEEVREQKQVMILVQPTQLDDAARIGDHLREGSCVLVNLEQTEHAEAVRILDFLKGFVYSSNGKCERMSREMFLFAPYGVELSGDLFHNMDE